MKILSLFDGISCGRVALERAYIPIEAYFASEVDKRAIQITQKNYPDTIQIGDVAKVNFADFVGKIDMLIGGSPCQDLSIGKINREGLKGSRSCLFWKFVEALRIIKPKYFLFENVNSMSKESKQEISKALGVEPILINSALVSAQQRKRLYWCNWATTQPQDKNIVLKDILETTGCPYQLKSYCLTTKYAKANFPHDFKKKNKIMIAVPIRVGQIGKGRQGKRIYSVHGKSISLSSNGGGGGTNTGLYFIYLPDGDYVIRKLTPLECERLQTLPDNYTIGLKDTPRYKLLGNGWTVDVVAHIFKSLREGK